MKELSEKKRKSRQRLGGGGGLSLPAFVNAKSKPRLNPADVRKKREHYENAKKVKKYRKLVKHTPHQEQKTSTEESIGGSNTDKYIVHVPTSDSNASQQRLTSDFVKKTKCLSGKRRNALEGLRQDFIKKKQEEDRVKAERMEALKVKEEARIKATQRRKDFKAKMFKRTNSGQPLMKHRLQHILESLQQGA
eukprot:c14098_g1_i1 orf=78-653(+)